MMVQTTGVLARREMIRMAGFAGLGAALLPHAARAAAGDPAGMEKVAEVLDKWVGPGKFPGMVAALGLPGQDPQFVTRGTDSFTDTDRQGPDSLYRIYSMTKPITGMAAMMLIDEGKLGLDQPLDDILPAYAKMQVQVTPDGSITDLRPAKTRITIRHCSPTHRGWAIRSFSVDR
jgi:CubicO group peptidase (beta-lactamase class C family)